MGKITCQICYKKRISLFGNKIIEINGEYVHQKCYEEQKKRKQAHREAIKEDKVSTQFTLILKNFQSDLEAMIQFEHSGFRDIKVRYFFGNEKSDVVYSRDFVEKSNTNTVYLKMMPASKQHSTNWIKKGVHDVGDNFESGYTIQVTLRKNDEKLRKNIITILQKYNFGCLPAAFSFHCHMNKENPTSDEAKKLLQSIVEEISAH